MVALDDARGRSHRFPRVGMGAALEPRRHSGTRSALLLRLRQAETARFGRAWNDDHIRQ